MHLVTPKPNNWKDSHIYGGTLAPFFLLAASLYGFSLTRLFRFAEIPEGVWVMNWKIDLDALIEETMAFAKSVTVGPISEASPVFKGVEQPVAELSPTLQHAPLTSPTSERDEIKRRVANFKAHQQKIAREREDYYLQVKAKTFALIGRNN
jgi:hypothetical protein